MSDVEEVHGSGGTEGPLAAFWMETHLGRCRLDIRLDGSCGGLPGSYQHGSRDRGFEELHDRPGVTPRSWLLSLRYDDPVVAVRRPGWAHKATAVTAVAARRFVSSQSSQSNNGGEGALRVAGTTVVI